jgi:hypothetical protein
MDDFIEDLKKKGYLRELNAKRIWTIRRIVSDFTIQIGS